MLRLLVLVLLLVNALLLAAQLGVFGSTGGAAGQREPERLQRQVGPDAVQILSAQAASAAQASLSASTSTTASPPPPDAASGAASGAAPAGPASQARAAAPAAALASAAPAAALASKAASAAAPGPAAFNKPSANSAALACLQVGPFAGADAEAAQRTLQAANLPAGSWQALTSDGGGAYMVYMGRYTDPDLLQRERHELARRKVAADDLTDTPALQPGLNLGRFETREAADAALARFAKRGVHTARVLTLQQAQAQTVLRLPAANAALRARLVGLRLPNGQNGPGFVACTAAGAASAPR